MPPSYAHRGRRAAVNDIYAVNLLGRPFLAHVVPNLADACQGPQREAEALRWKLDGLSECHVCRPLTATGTNLLGLVEDVAIVGSGYFGFVFDRLGPETFRTRTSRNLGPI
jgi:hypothetical protein